MQLVVGLGNPGPKYARNRHNVGFMVVERLAERAKNSDFREKFEGLFCKTQFRGHDVVMLQPMTYMNLSGQSVQQAMRFFRVSRQELVVVHDELDLPFGEFRLKVGGGTAGHNGLRSIVQQCGGQDFARLRVGIGKPRSGSVEGYVLGDFSSAEAADLPDVLDRAADCLGCLITDGVQVAMNRFNVRAGSGRAGASKAASSPADSNNQS
jgi:PTH1 family peptidyl-tRNA hydrolase